MIILYLACADDDEAKAIGQALLEAKLIVCARRFPIQSSYWWAGKIQNDDEVLLMMESLEEKFSEIEAIVTKLHSYKEYVLTMETVDKTTPGVEQWLEEVITSKQ